MSAAPQEKSFQIGSSPQDRVTAFLEAGIPAASIAEVAGVDEDTVTSWQEDSSAELSNDSRAGLNNLRQAMKAIIDNGVAPDAAAVWLQTPLRADSENTPLGHLAKEPQVVIDGVRKIFGPTEAALSPNALKYKKAGNARPQPGSLFTKREELVLPYITHHSNLKDIDKIFESQGDPISRLLRLTRERVGGETLIDFMLIAIATGAANVDHVTPGKTQALIVRDKGHMADYYSPDFEERSATRRNIGVSWWTEVYRQLDIRPTAARPLRGGYGRHTAVLYGVRDGVIQVPDIADIQAGRHPKPISKRKSTSC